MRCETTHSSHAVPVVKPPRTQVVCPTCGPFYRRRSDTIGACPTCNLTPGEHAYIARIVADSAAVYAQEVREFNARRTKGGP